jgi:hypothetical protein
VIRRIGAGVVAAVLASGAWIAVSATPSAAQNFPGVVCKAHLAGDLVIDIDVPRDLSATIDAPTQTFVGTDVTVTVHGGTTELPSTNSGLQIDSYQDLSTRYKITGGTIVPGSAVPAGSATINGHPTPGTATLDGTDQIILATPGPIPPGTLVTPNTSFKIHAGAAGTAVTTSVVKSFTKANLPAYNAVATVNCPYPTNTLSTTQVVNPPVAGAPNAVADVATTPFGQPVTIHVLANDEPDPGAPIDVSSLAVTSGPAKGTAAVNADHTVTYTPTGCCGGIDSFKYQICSQQQSAASRRVAAALAEGCTEATVTVNVGAPSTTSSTKRPSNPGSGAAGGSATTVHSGGSSGSGTLPRTGSSSAPLAILALMFLGAGGALLASLKRGAA